MPVGKHSKKEVQAALRFAEEHGWSVEQTASGHRWGVAKCGHGCELSVWSTPKNPGNHAKAIRRSVERCPHTEQSND